MAAKIRECGNYQYLASTHSNDEFLVYCSNDRQNWTAYLMRTRINKVWGPLKPNL